MELIALILFPEFNAMSSANSLSEDKNHYIRSLL